MILHLIGVNSRWASHANWAKTVGGVFQEKIQRLKWQRNSRRIAAAGIAVAALRKFKGSGGKTGAIAE